MELQKKEKEKVRLTVKLTCTVRLAESERSTNRVRNYCFSDTLERAKGKECKKSRKMTRKQNVGRRKRERKLTQRRTKLKRKNNRKKIPREIKKPNGRKFQLRLNEREKSAAKGGNTNR